MGDIHLTDQLFVSQGNTCFGEKARKQLVPISSLILENIKRGILVANTIAPPERHRSQVSGLRSQQKQPDPRRSRKTFLSRIGFREYFETYDISDGINLVRQRTMYGD